MKKFLPFIIVIVIIAIIILISASGSKAAGLGAKTSGGKTPTGSDKDLYDLWLFCNSQGISSRDKSRVWRDTAGTFWRGKDATVEFMDAYNYLKSKGYSLPELNNTVMYNDKSGGLTMDDFKKFISVVYTFI